MVQVSIIMGSESDRPIADRAVSVLEKTKYTYDVVVISAHRNPDELEEYVPKIRCFCLYYNCRTFRSFAGCRGFENKETGHRCSGQRKIRRS